MEVGTTAQRLTLFPLRHLPLHYHGKNLKQLYYANQGFFLGILHKSWMEEVQEKGDHIINYNFKNGKVGQRDGSAIKGEDCNKNVSK